MTGKILTAFYHKPAYCQDLICDNFFVFSYLQCQLRTIDDNSGQQRTAGHKKTCKKNGIPEFYEAKNFKWSGFWVEWIATCGLLLRILRALGLKQGVYALKGKSSDL